MSGDRIADQRKHFVQKHYVDDIADQFNVLLTKYAVLINLHHIKLQIYV